jgi:hypothetical protein
MKTYDLNKQSELDLLKRANYLTKLIIRDKNKLLFTGYPEKRIKEFLEKKSRFQKLTADIAYRCHQWDKTDQRQHLREQIETFLSKMSKKMVMAEHAEPLDELNFSNINFTTIDDESLVNESFRFVHHAQNQPAYYKEFRVNAATIDSIEMLSKQMRLVLEEEKLTLVKRLQFSMERSDLYNELTELIQDLCAEGKKLWKHQNAANYHDYMICSKQSTIINTTITHPA